jgi:hypothetical protein
MSHHHMLAPIVYAPQPKPRKIEARKSRIRMHGYGVDDAGEIAESFASETSLPPAASATPAVEDLLPIEGPERKPQQPQGRLSEATLKVMLQAQELDQASAAASPHS